MALAAPTLARYDELVVAGTGFATGSWSQASASLFVAQVIPYKSTGNVEAVATLAGNGLTWSRVPNGTTTAADGNTQLEDVWMAYGVATAGATTATFATSHTSCVIAIYRQSGVTSTAAVLQAWNDRNFNAASLTITLPSPPASAASSIFGLFGIKAPSSGGNTAVTPGTSFTELVEDRIDARRQVYMEYQLAGDQTVDLTLTGYSSITSHHIFGVALEIASAVPVVGKVQIIVDIDPNTLPGSEPSGDTGGPPTDVGSSVPIDDPQALTARPSAARSTDLPVQLGSLEAKVARLEGALSSQMGFAPLLDEDPPTSWPDGATWIRTTTGELCWRVAGVTQVAPPSTPIGDPDRPEDA